MASSDGDYDYWYAALEGRDPPYQRDKPQAGCYQFRSGTTRIGIRIWRNDAGELVGTASTANKPYDPDPLNLATTWPVVARHPLPFETWEGWYNSDGQWPDEPQKAAEPPAVIAPAADNAARKVLDAEVALVEEGIAAIGHNSRNFAALDGAGDDKEAADAIELLGEINDLSSSALAVLRKGVTSQTDADLAQNIANKVTEAAKRIEDAYEQHRKRFEQPLLDYRDRWRALREAPEALKGRLRVPVRLWMQAEEDRARREAEEQTKETGEVVAPAKVRAGGAGGKAKAALRTYTTAEITDFVAVAAHFINNADLRKLLQKLADAAVSVGAKVPGATIKQERR
jgi:hypothetical protein